MKKEYQKPVSTPYSFSPFLMLTESSGTSIEEDPGVEDAEGDAREDNTTVNGGGNNIWDNVW